MITKNKKLIICADDFGIAKNINTAIYELAQKKRISAISCIISSEANRLEFAHLRSCKNQFLGLHFNLTHTAFNDALKKQPSPEQSILNLYGSVLKNNFSQKKIEIEFEKQWNLFCDLVQSEPDYLDSHHHVHQFPIISDAILNVLGRTKLKPNFFIRNTANSAQLDSLFIKKALLNFLGKRLQKKLRKINIDTNKNFTGFYDYSNMKMNFNILSSFLHNASDDTLMMVHPSLGDTPELNDLMQLSRQSEYDLLMTSEFMDLIKQFGFEIKFKENDFQL